MGYPRVTAEEWAKRALTVNATWLEIPTNTKSKFKLRCLTCTHEWAAIGNWPFSEFCKFVDMLIEGEAAHA